MSLVKLCRLARWWIRGFHVKSYRRRLSFPVRPTGMWQVSGRSDITDFEEIVCGLDVEYIDNLVSQSDSKFYSKHFWLFFGKQLCRFSFYAQNSVLGNAYILIHYFKNDKVMGEPTLSTNNDKKKLWITQMENGCYDLESGRILNPWKKQQKKKINEC